MPEQGGGWRRPGRGRAVPGALRALPGEGRRLWPGGDVRGLPAEGGRRGWRQRPGAAAGNARPAALRREPRRAPLLLPGLWGGAAGTRPSHGPRSADRAPPGCPAPVGGGARCPQLFTPPPQGRTLARRPARFGARCSWAPPWGLLPAPLSRRGALASVWGEAGWRKERFGNRSCVFGTPHIELLPHGDERGACGSRWGPSSPPPRTPPSISAPPSAPQALLLLPRTPVSTGTPPWGLAEPKHRPWHSRAPPASLTPFAGKKIIQRGSSPG